MRRHLSILATSLLMVALASCTHATSVDTSEGRGEPDWNNPVEGEKVSVDVAASLVPFGVEVPDVPSLGTLESVFVTRPGTARPEIMYVGLVYSSDNYGTVDLVESAPQEVNWESFIHGVVDAQNMPKETPGVTVTGSSEIVKLTDGSDALITTTEDGSRSDITWQNPKGTLEFGVAGPSIDRVAAVTIANDIVAWYSSA